MYVLGLHLSYNIPLGTFDTSVDPVTKNHPSGADYHPMNVYPSLTGIGSFPNVPPGSISSHIV